MNKRVKKWSAIALGLFLMVITNVFGQAPEGPVKITFDRDLYQHGYDKDHTTNLNPLESVDTVMVGSKMQYFVMPDPFYNKTYSDAGNYTNTSATTSTFTWTIPNGIGNIPSGKTNGSGSSPLMEITWSNTPVNQFNIEVVETPSATAFPGLNCPGAKTEIPVVIIAKPTAKFGELSGSRLASQCVTNADATGSIATPVTFQFPISATSGIPTTSFPRYEVTYTITKDNGNPSASATKALVGNNLELVFDALGVYVVTITKITDRIARKCLTEGTLSSIVAENSFTLGLYPQPKAGKSYHVPNNF